MQQLLQFFILLPFIAFTACLFMPKKNEKLIAALTIIFSGTFLTGIIAFTIYWLLNKAPVLDSKHFVFFKKEDIEIYIDFYFDKTAAVFTLTGAVLFLLVAIFSKYYLHREEGFKRFFCTILLFFLGYNFIILSGNFETLFVGWEILGLCSFLLISFYRDRYLPVKNALKTISLYRLGDVCLMLAMWMSHHLWHKNITFLDLNNLQAVEEHLKEHNWYGVFIAGMIVIAAAVKSAQLPFSSWMPRAMEGPTSSSAIFYGSLSVHIGVFLLIRTYPYWESLLSIKLLIIFIGLATAIIANGIAGVQSSVKTQIAYSSISQIGLMFIEVASGLHVLALIHFAGNAFLRTYQLLVSPSVLSYLTHNMFYHFKPAVINGNIAGNSFKNSLYILNIKEWNIDFLLYRYLWSPFKWIGNKLNFLINKWVIIVLILLYVTGLSINEFREYISIDIIDLLPFIYSFAGLLLILRSFVERGEAIQAWILVISGQLFITLSVVLLNEDFGYHHIILFLSGSLTAAIIGYICLKKMKALDNNVILNLYHGYIYEHPNFGFVFLLCCLGIIGLPFTPTFIGIDLLFNHIHKHQEILIIFTSVSFLFIEISLFRIYARVFLGQHIKPNHPIAYRSS